MFNWLNKFPNGRGRSYLYSNIEVNVHMLRGYRHRIRIVDWNNFVFLHIIRRTGRHLKNVVMRHNVGNWALVLRLELFYRYLILILIQICCAFALLISVNLYNYVCIDHLGSSYTIYGKSMVAGEVVNAVDVMLTFFECNINLLSSVT